MQLPLGIFEPSSGWTPPDLSALPSWKGIKRIGCDTETKDPQLKQLGPGPRRDGSHVVGVSFAIEDGPGFYLPIRHEGGGNLDLTNTLRYLRDNAAAFDGTLVGMNLGYDLDFLAEEGVTFDNTAWFRDISVADPLINELHQSYSMASIAERWGILGKDEVLLREAANAYGVDPKAQMYALHSKYVGPYGTQDAVLPLEILRRQERVIDDEDLWQIYDLESKLVPLLVRMRRRGVRIDQDKLAQIVKWTETEEAAAWAQIQSATGVRLRVGDAWKPEALAPALEAIGVTVPKTAGKKPKPSVTKELLARIDHPVARAMEQARKVNKLRTTFAASIYNHMTNGRIHCSFNQLRAARDADSDESEGDNKGAAYGRLSSEHPNMQQQPARDEFAKMWRSIYLPDEGALWAACDYSQQEPRMVVHYACKARAQIGDYAWRKAIAARDAYRNDPTTDNHQMMADMANIKRKAAKEIFLGLCYGMGGAKLCTKLGLPTEMIVYGPKGISAPARSPEGQRLIAEGCRQFLGAGAEGRELLGKFDAEVPFVTRLAKACQKKAQQVGYITTLCGRRCRFPTDENGNYDWTHKGLNRLIQGSSADQTKKAMVMLFEAGYDPQLQVHDEIDGSVESPAEATAMAEIMATCVPLELPSKVDVEIGPSWGESMS